MQESEQHVDSSGSAGITLIVPAAPVAGGKVETRVLCGFTSPVGIGGKSDFWLFPDFHGGSFPPRSRRTSQTSPSALIDMLAVRFGPDQAHCGKPPNTRPLSAPCAGQQKVA